MIVAGLLLVTFLVWRELPDHTKSDVLSSLFNKKPAQTKLGSEQIKDRDFYAAMGDDSDISNPKLALAYYQKALEIDPQNEEIRKKADSIRQLLVSGGSQ